MEWILLCGVLLLFAPNSQARIELSVYEERSPRTLVTNLQVTTNLSLTFTPDVLNQLQFEMFKPSDVAERYFRIEGNNLVTTRPIDRDVVCAFLPSCHIEIDITVKPLSYFQFFEFTVRVLDTNDNVPRFPDSPEGQVIWIPEDSAAQSFSLTDASDPDEGLNSVQSYYLTGDSGPFQLTYSHGDTGAHDLKLTVDGTLDRENQASYRFVVWAVDGASPPLSGSSIVQVNIRDINDHAPVFELSRYEAELAENSNPGSILVTVRAGDKDEGPNGVVDYSFAPQTSTLYSHLFTIDSGTGAIRARTRLDHEESARYVLTVKATDQASSPLTGETQVVIVVTDQNDNPPEITVNGNENVVMENSAVGEFVAHISVDDLDSGANGEYTCGVLSSAYTFELREVASGQFSLRTLDVLNREDHSSVTFNITCTDKGFPVRKSSEYFVVQVGDENDNAPAFDQFLYEREIDENRDPGEVLMQARASDPDLGNNATIVYEIQPQGLYDMDILRIEPTSGVITTLRGLDYERQKQAVFYIIARDQGTPSMSATASLVLKVKDINDIRPRFSQSGFAFIVKENALVGSLVGNVTAYDLDSSPNNEIYYSLIDDSQDMFNIDGYTGVLFLNKPLNYTGAVGTTFTITVIASNIGYDLSDRVTVSVYVEDINDHKPVIDYPTRDDETVVVLSAYIRGDFVTQIIAHDADQGMNARLRYTLHGEEPAPSLFDVDDATGRVTVRATNLHGYGNVFMAMTIVVRDLGIPSLSSSETLNIYINTSAILYDSTGTDEKVLNNASYVIIVVVISLLLVCIATVVFVILFLRRRKQKKRQPIYACRVEQALHKEAVGEDYEGHLTQLPDVLLSEKRVSTSSDLPPPYYRPPEVFHRERPPAPRPPSVSSEEKRVTFRDTPDTISEETRDPRGSYHNWMQPAPPRHNPSLLPAVMEGSRRKLLYGGSGGKGHLSTFQGPPLGGALRVPDDVASDQSSLTDSGKGQSDEDTPTFPPPPPRLSSISASKMGPKQSHMDPCGFSPAHSRGYSADLAASGSHGRQESPARPLPSQNVGVNPHRANNTHLPLPSNFHSKPGSCENPPLPPRSSHPFVQNPNCRNSLSPNEIPPHYPDPPSYGMHRKQKYPSSDDGSTTSGSYVIEEQGDMSRDIIV